MTELLAFLEGRENAMVELLSQLRHLLRSWRQSPTPLNVQPYLDVGIAGVHDVSGDWTEFP